MTELLTQDSIGRLKTRLASDDVHRPSIMIYGDSGIGKTSLAASACEVEDMSPVLHINMENGTQSIAELYPQLEIIDVRTFKELQEAFNALHRGKGLGYRTVILDNLTEGQKKGMEYYFSKAEGENPTNFLDFSLGAWGDKSYQINSEQMRRLIRAFRDLPMNTILVAWERDYGKDSKHRWGPSFSPAFAAEAPGMVNDCYRYYMNGGVRILQTAKTDTAAGKDRTRRLPPTIENPTMRIIWEYWTGQRVYTPESKSTASSNVSKPKGK